MSTDPTAAEIEAGARAYCAVALDSAGHWTGLAPPAEISTAVLRAVLPDVEARVRRQVAEEIRADADRHAPAGHPLNHPRTALRRHLLSAARIAVGPVTPAEVAAALARQHAERNDDA